jgi:hypothetical protein
MCSLSRGCLHRCQARLLVLARCQASPGPRHLHVCANNDDACTSSTGAVHSGLLAAVAAHGAATARRSKAVQTGPVCCMRLSRCLPVAAVRTPSDGKQAAAPLAVARRSKSLLAHLTTSHSLLRAARDMRSFCYLSDRLGFLPQAGYPSRCCMFLAVNRVPVVAAVSAPRDSPNSCPRHPPATLTATPPESAVS